MTGAGDVFGTAFRGGSLTLLARIAGNDAINVLPADVSAMDYTIYRLDAEDPDVRLPVEGHAAVAITPAEALFATLQTDAVWTADAIGYNFRQQLDVSEHAAFADVGRYLVEYRLMPQSGQVVLVRFRIEVV